VLGVLSSVNPNIEGLIKPLLLPRHPQTTYTDPAWVGSFDEQANIVNQTVIPIVLKKNMNRIT